MKIAIVLCLLLFNVIVLSQVNYPVINKVVFGTITIDGVEYEKDVFIVVNTIKKRSKKPSKHLRSKYRHTPLSLFEDIPWDCDTLVIGSGISGKLPLTRKLKKYAKKNKVTLIILKTKKAIEYYNTLDKSLIRVNAVFHITC